MPLILSFAAGAATALTLKLVLDRKSSKYRKNGEFQGTPVGEFTDDQKAEMQRILKLLLEPFRQSDQDEVVKCLQAQGGLDQCHLAFYEEGDLGEDKIYDNWRLEGPSFVWYFRGRPHVHVWVNVADDPSVKLNSAQDSVGV